MMKVRTMAVLAALALLGGCMTSMGGGPAGGAAAELRDAAGAVKGTAGVVGLKDGLHVTATVAGMAPGTYGIHLHQVGVCTPPDFASAGPHWNPGGRQHGIDNPMGSHAGDLPNIVIDANGRGTLTVILPGTLDGLLDADGAAMVIHAKRDDYKTDPSGNSGARLACGVLTRS